MKKIIFSLGLFSFVSSVYAGVFCGAESGDGSRAYIRINTTGDQMEIQDGLVTVNDKNGKSLMSVPLERKDIFHYYEGCMDLNCNEVIIALRAFKGRFYPFNLRFIGPDYSTATTQDFIRVDNLLKNPDRKFLQSNIMKVSSMDKVEFNSSLEFDDVICVTTK